VKFYLFGKLRTDNLMLNSEFLYRMPNELPALDFNDTFLDKDHVISSFPEYEVVVKDDGAAPVTKPFRYNLQI